MNEKIQEALDAVVQKILSEVKTVPMEDLKQFSAAIAKDSITMVASVVESGNLVDIGKVYRELYAQALLLAEIARIRLARSVMEKIVAAVWTAAEVALKLAATA